MPCSDHAVLFNATAQHVLRKTACGLSARGRLLPATTRTSTKVIISIPISDAGGQCETKQRLSWTRKRVVAAHYEKYDMLNCWAGSSDISGYHADFHEGHGTIGAWQGRGMARVNSRLGMTGERHGRGMGTAWARHAMCESALTVSSSASYPGPLQVRNQKFSLGGMG